MILKIKFDVVILWDNLSSREALRLDCLRPMMKNLYGIATSEQRWRLLNQKKQNTQIGSFFKDDPEAKKIDWIENQAGTS